MCGTNKRRRVLSGVFLSFFVIGLPFIGCAKQRDSGLVIKDGVLSVGVEIGYPPMEYYDEDGVTPAGFDIELAKALADKLNLQVKFIDARWEGILAGLDSDRYDIAVNVTILPERQRRYNFTKPYIDSFMTIVTLKNSPLKIETPRDIEGRRTAYQGGTTAQYFTEKLGKQGVKFSSFSYDKITNCFDDLRLKRLDLVVVDNIAAFYYAGREDRPGGRPEDYPLKKDNPFKIAWCGPSDEYIGICLKKGNNALTAALNSALDELFADGAMLEISKKFFNGEVFSNLRFFETAR
jgi:polar amino acid transport system substrate-binding protein